MIISYLDKEEFMVINTILIICTTILVITGTYYATDFNYSIAKWLYLAATMLCIIFIIHNKLTKKKASQGSTSK